jgi:hypothetical protein
LLAEFTAADPTRRGDDDTRRLASFSELLLPVSVTRPGRSGPTVLADARLVTTNMSPDGRELIVDLAHTVLVAVGGDSEGGSTRRAPPCAGCLACPMTPRPGWGQKLDLLRLVSPNRRHPEFTNAAMMRNRPLRSRESSKVHESFTYSSCLNQVMRVHSSEFARLGVATG